MLRLVYSDLLSFSHSTMFSLMFTFLLVNDVRTDWPSSARASVQLVNLFDDEFDSSIPSPASAQCRVMLEAAICLAELSYITIDGNSIGWQSANEDDEVIRTLGHTCSALSTTALASMVTSGFSHRAPFISQVARRIGVSVIAYVASDRLNRHAYPNVHRTSPSGTSASLAIARLFQRIHQNGALGLARDDVLSQAFELDGLGMT